jgi:hypothetical protein
MYIRVVAETSIMETKAPTTEDIENLIALISEGKTMEETKAYIEKLIAYNSRCCVINAHAFYETCSKCEVLSVFDANVILLLYEGY